MHTMAAKAIRPQQVGIKGVKQNPGRIPMCTEQRRTRGLLLVLCTIEVDAHVQGS